MREIRQSGSEGGAAQLNAPFLPPMGLRFGATDLVIWVAICVKLCAATVEGGNG